MTLVTSRIKLQFPPPPPYTQCALLKYIARGSLFMTLVTSRAKGPETSLEKIRQAVQT